MLPSARPLSHYQRSALEWSFYRLGELQRSGALLAREDNPLRLSAAIEFLMLLHNVLSVADAMGRRVALSLDVGTHGDVTALVAACRNAVCHPPSGRHAFAPGLVFSYGVAFGAGRILESPAGTIDTKFPDDAAFVFGRNIVYVRRHLYAAAAIALASLRAELNPWLSEGTSGFR